MVWGYDDPLAKLAQKVIAEEDAAKMKGQFGLLVGKNGTVDWKYTVRTGMKDPDMIGQVVEWNGRREIDAWGSKDWIGATDRISSH